MNEKDKMLQYSFYLGALVLFVFAVCYFSTSHIDGRRGEDVGARIDDSQNINSELQDGNRKLQQEANDSQREIEGVIRGLGNAEAELDRAASAIERCQSILETAKRRAQESNKTPK